MALLASFFNFKEMPPAAFFEDDLLVHQERNSSHSIIPLPSVSNSLTAEFISESVRLSPRYSTKF